MSDKFLSQEEIDSLMQKNQMVNPESDELSVSEKDILGEVGNISMSTAATTLSTLLNRQVSITTPRVDITTLNKVIDSLIMPYVILQVKFEEGLHGSNILMMSIRDASIISNIMMGGDGSQFNEHSLSDLELSAVSEAMNQMIGSASTAVSTMLNRRIDINPPITQVGDSANKIEMNDIKGEEHLACIVFKLNIDDLVDSEIMQIYSLDTAKEIADTMLGSIQNKESDNASVVEKPSAIKEEEIEIEIENPQQEQKREYEKNVQVQKPQFVPLKESKQESKSRNIDLILDVPLEMSVILGRTQQSIKEVLALEPGSIVELEKYAEEPLDIYVNGKLIAQGEVVVLDEKFGIRINSILSTKDRVETLK